MDYGVQEEDVSEHNEEREAYTWVTVRREKCTFHKDSLLYTNTKGKEERTTDDEWTRGKFQGYDVWFHKGKKHTYITRRLG